MSMLTRKGTLVVGKRGSINGHRRARRSRSSTSSSSTPSVSGSFRRHHSDSFKEGHGHTRAPPLKTFADVVLSFDDERQLVRSSVGWDHHMNIPDEQDFGTLMYQIMEADKESENIVEFGCRTSNIICNTLCVTLLVGVMLAVPIAMVSIGVKYLEECPKEPRIPLYLLVGGCFGLLKIVSTLWKNVQSRRYHDIEVVFDESDSDDVFESTTYRTMDTILFVFLVGWQIAGTYWTLSIWQPHFEQLLHEPSNWCDKTVYMFSVYQLFGTYVIMCVFMFVIFLLMFWHRCCYGKH